MSDSCKKPLCKHSLSNRSQVRCKIAYYTSVLAFFVTLGEITMVIGSINATMSPIIRLPSCHKSQMFLLQVLLCSRETVSKLGREMLKQEFIPHEEITNEMTETNAFIKLVSIQKCMNGSPGNVQVLLRGLHRHISVTVSSKLVTKL